MEAVHHLSVGPQPGGNRPNNGEAVLHDALPTLHGTVTTTITFPSAGAAAFSCAGLLVGGLGGSFHPGDNAFTAWEISLSTKGFLRLGSHSGDFKLLKQVAMAVPLGKAMELSVLVKPSAPCAAAAGCAEFTIAVDGQQRMHFVDRRRGLGPAVALRSYDTAVTYSTLKISAAAPEHGHGHNHQHGVGLSAPGSNLGLETHGVNNGEALKEGAVRFRLSHNASDALSSHTRMDLLDKYHGAASGIFSCDEHLAGLHPSHGTELCTVVEGMFSYETMFSIHGDAVFAERAERLAYNALPAELTEDMWSHQYLQQPNAIIAAVQQEHFWATDGPDATTMNLEPNFPCCTGNFNQGWTKFVSHIAFVQPKTKTLALALLAPCAIAADLGDGAVAVNVTTAYPWGDRVQLSVSTPASMTLAVRIPSWATEAKVNGEQAANGTLHQIRLKPGQTSLLVTLPMEVRAERRYNDAVSLHRGPLLYSLDIVATETKLPYCSNKKAIDGSTLFCSNATFKVERFGSELRNATPWNWALELGSGDIAKQVTFEQVSATPATPLPFATAASPVALHVAAEQVAWGTEKGSAAAPPPSPVQSQGGAKEMLRLIPYSSTHGLSMVELPVLATSRSIKTDDRAGPPADVLSALSDVKGSLHHAYDLKDSTGEQMASLHLLPHTEGASPADRTYHAVYMSMLPKALWEVRVANSSDLIHWRFHRKILPNADMPYAKQLTNGWILLAHEQWMKVTPGPGSASPSRLGFKLYYSLADLLAGRHFNSFVAPLTQGRGSSLEGTPNVYSATVAKRGGLYMVDAEVGFHYNDAKGVDTVGHGSLRSFGPTSKEAEIGWTTVSATGYDAAFKKVGCVGNVGQRDAGTIGGSVLMMQEGNTGHMPPTVWADWRLWIYTPAPSENVFSTGPTGAGQITELKPKTDGGSSSFGNPSFKLVPCPGSAAAQCVFVSYFAFSQGAAPGEAGVVAFVSAAPGPSNATAGRSLASKMDDDPVMPDLLIPPWEPTYNLSESTMTQSCFGPARIGKPPAVQPLTNKSGQFMRHWGILTLDCRETRRTEGK